MTKSTCRKKTGLATCTLNDWNRADIKAALEKAGWSLRQLSISYGLTPKTFQHALHRPYPKAEAAIASAIGVLPQVIWPSRYDRYGQPNRKRGPKARTPQNKQPSQSTKIKNLDTQNQSGELDG